MTGTTEVLDIEVVSETDADGNEKCYVAVDVTNVEKIQLTLTDGVANESIQFYTYYGYWDAEANEWVNGEGCSNYTTVFDENGTAVLIIPVPEDEHCTSLQIGIGYYCSWSNEAGDMVPNDQSVLTWEVVVQYTSDEITSA